MTERHDPLEAFEAPSMSRASTAPQHAAEPAHRALAGSISFVLAVSSAVSVVGLVVMISVRKPLLEEMNEGEMWIGRLLAIAFVGCLGLALVSLAVGLFAIVSSTSGRVLAIWGIAIATLVLFFPCTFVFTAALFSSG